jgi:uncharacterized protein YdhG (YjbR/CyaY superfamily)
METKKASPTTVDDYIAQYPEDLQAVLNKIRAVIKEAAPEAVEKISYGMPGFFLNGGLVWFGVYKRHIGFYPLTDGMEAAIEGLSAYKGTKSSVHFRLDQPLPYELIEKIVKYRLGENQKS